MRIWSVVNLAVFGEERRESLEIHPIEQLAVRDKDIGDGLDLE